MTYSTVPSLLDFDDDIFLGTSSSSPVVSETNSSGNRNDPLEGSDSKGMLFDSLIANTIKSPQA